MLKSCCTYFLLLSFMLGPFAALCEWVDWTLDSQESTEHCVLDAASPDVLAKVRSSAESLYELLRGVKAVCPATEGVTFVTTYDSVVVSAPVARFVPSDAQQMITSGLRLQV